MDSNHRTPKRTDLQSVAVGHLATCPAGSLQLWAVSYIVEPLVGLEPTTCWLQISCSTNWAKVAFTFKKLSTNKDSTFNLPDLISGCSTNWAKVAYYIYWSSKLAEIQCCKELPVITYVSTVFFGKAKVTENVKYKNFEKEIFTPNQVIIRN